MLSAARYLRTGLSSPCRHRAKLLALFSEERAKCVIRVDPKESECGQNDGCKRVSEGLCPPPWSRLSRAQNRTKYLLIHTLFSMKSSIIA